MEHLIKLTIEQHIENGESYYLATSSDIQGLVAEGRTLTETLEIAQDVAKLILQDKHEEMALLPTVPKKLDYSLVVNGDVMTKNNNDLYHYTTIDGLKGIIGSNTLWSTHYKFLNDSSELIAAKEQLMIALEKEHCELLYGYIEKARPETHITCFGTHNNTDVQNDGLLSLWRSYANGGFAIVFDRKKMEYFVSKEEEIVLDSDNEDFIFIDEVSYEAKHENFEENVKKLKEELRKFNADKEGYIKDKSNDLLKAFFKCIALYKHKGFHEEKEVRIVTHLSDDSKKTREIRGNKVYIDLFGFKEEEIKYLPIKKIIIGPCKDSDFKYEWLKIYLKSQGRADIKIRVSEIPYIG